MSVAYYIVPESEIDAFDHFVNGKALGHASEAKLTKLCRSLGIKPLFEFLSQDLDELAMMFEDVDLEDVPEVKQEWFLPAEGLKTVATLANHLRLNPDEMKSSSDIVEDLEEYEFVLERLSKENVRWHLALDF